MLSLVVFLAFLGSAAPAEAVEIDFGRVESHISDERWNKALGVLHEGLMSVIEAGGEMDGADLTSAVRLRALIEAGKGRTESARWWWHAGLNLQSRGSAKALSLVSDEVGAPLALMTVRSRRPTQATKRASKRKSQPAEIASPLHRTAVRRGLEGLVSFEVEVGKGGKIERPLLISSTVPTVAVYTALDKHDGWRLPVDWYRSMPPTFVLDVRYRGK